MYLLIQLYTGALPWDNVTFEQDSFNQSKAKIKEKKLNATVEEICRSCPEEFKTMLRYTKSLTFKDKPDYEGLSSLVAKMASRENIDLDDGIYDWNIRAIMIKDFPQLYSDLDDPW